jgi:hypothetical protein
MADEGRDSAPGSSEPSGSSRGARDATGQGPTGSNYAGPFDPQAQDQDRGLTAPPGGGLFGGFAGNDFTNPGFGPGTTFGDFAGSLAVQLAGMLPGGMVMGAIANALQGKARGFEDSRIESNFLADFIGGIVPGANLAAMGGKGLAGLLNAMGMNAPAQGWDPGHGNAGNPSLAGSPFGGPTGQSALLAQLIQLLMAQGGGGGSLPSPSAPSFSMPVRRRDGGASYSNAAMGVPDAGMPDAAALLRGVMGQLGAPAIPGGASPMDSMGTGLGAALGPILARLLSGFRDQRAMANAPPALGGASPA